MTGSWMGNKPRNRLRVDAVDDERRPHVFVRIHADAVTRLDLLFDLIQVVLELDRDLLGPPIRELPTIVPQPVVPVRGQ